jgi:hypothetical protein
MTRNAQHGGPSAVDSFAASNRPMAAQSQAEIPRTRARRFARNKLAWAVAAVSAIASAVSFGATPLAFALPPLIFIAVAGWDDARRLRRAWHERHGQSGRSRRIPGTLAEPPADPALASLQVARRTVAETASIGAAAIGATTDGVPALAYLAENPERDPAAPQRRSRRMPQEMLFCNLGQVLDLSRGGMRVRLARDQFPEGIVIAEILAPDGPLRIKAELVWTRIDDRSRDAGFRFLDLPPESAQRITAICMQHRCRATISRGSAE